MIIKIKQEEKKWEKNIRQKEYKKNKDNDTGFRCLTVVWAGKGLYWSTGSTLELVICVTEGSWKTIKHVIIISHSANHHTHKLQIYLRDSRQRPDRAKPVNNWRTKKYKMKLYCKTASKVINKLPINIILQLRQWTIDTEFKQINSFILTLKLSHSVWLTWVSTNHLHWSCWVGRNAWSAIWFVCPRSLNQDHLLCAQPCKLINKNKREFRKIFSECEKPFFCTRPAPGAQVLLTLSGLQMYFNHETCYGKWTALI